MNNKVAAFLVAIILINIVVIAVGFSYLQSEIDNLKAPSPTPTSPAASTPKPSPIGTVPPSSEPTEKTLPYKYTVFEWYIKKEFINNTTWLSTVGPYDANKTWVENYRALISGNGGSAFPAQLHDSTAAIYYTVRAFVSVEFNEQTGWTKATYKYLEQDGEPYLYTVETSLFYFVKNSDLVGWKEYYV